MEIVIDQQLLSQKERQVSIFFLQIGRVRRKGNMGATRELVEWILKANYTDLPKETVEFTKGLLLKTATSMIIGAREPFGKMVIRYLSRVGGTPEAGVVGAGFRTSIENASFANGILAHCTETEDAHFFPNNDAIAGCWIFPAMITLGEQLVSSGKEIIAASAFSWEVAARMVQAAPGMTIPGGINCATYFGTAAVAVGAARLLRLSPEQTENALSIATTQASGLVVQLGYDAHTLEAGHSCRAGLLSASLAEAGATGIPNILERKNGFFAPVWKQGVVDLTKITEGLGRPPFDVHNIEFKKYQGCGFMHPSVDALMMLMKEQSINYEQVERVEADVPPYYAQLCDRPFPESIALARFSFQFILGQVLLAGQIDYETFKEETLFDPKSRAAQSKVKITVNPNLPKADKGGRVTIFKKDGQKLTKYLEAYWGHPLNPITLEQIRDILRPYLDAILLEKQRERVENLMLNLENLADISELMNILTFFRNPQLCLD
jgi:2-methylcitrate dehydratase PrpD